MSPSKSVLEWKWSAMESIERLAKAVDIKTSVLKNNGVAFYPSKTLAVRFLDLEMSLMWLAGYAAAKGMMDEHTEAFKIGTLMSGNIPEVFTEAPR